MMKIEGSTEPSAVDEIWHLREPREGQVGINAENVSDTKGAGVRVALCDLGVEWTHPGLLDRIDTDRARDFDSTLDPAGLSHEQGRIIDKFDAHGTACAGLVCGVEDPKRATDVAQGKRCVGVAPEAKLVPIRISTNFELRSLIAALKYAEENAHVILIPRVLPGDKELEAELRIVASHVPVVCACGNDGTPQLAYPAALPETIAVGACNSRGYRSTYSQYGQLPETCRQVDVVACSNDIPVEDRELVRLDMEEVGLRELKARGRTDHTIFRTGMLGEDYLFAASAKNGWNLDRFGELSIATTDNLGEYGYNFDPPGDYCKPTGDFGFGGTSAAAAQVAGVVALMLSSNNELKGQPEAVREILRRTASHKFLHREQTGEDACREENGRLISLEFGYGLVNAAAAVAVAGEWKRSR